MQPSPNTKHLLAACVLAALLPTQVLAQAQSEAQAGDLGSCGNLRNSYGPFDYRTDRQQLVIVEAYHFNSAVEQLIRGTTGTIGGDLDYTLRAYPNHHRALSAMSRYGEKLKDNFVPGAAFSVECYFVRAVNHRPDDPTVRMLYAVYLKGQKRLPDALKQLAYAETITADSGYTHFNIGMVYAELGDYEAALRQAHKAMALGFTRPELKARLVAAKKWVEPPPAATAAAAAEPASAPR
jgi:tetratricopeptide (TPR) repeat protein